MTADDRTEISDLCLLAGRPELATCYLEQGLSAEAVKESLLKLTQDDKPLGRAEILAGAGLDAHRKLAMIDVPRLGGQLWVRELDPIERQWLSDYAANGSDRAAWLSGCILLTTLVDEHGHQLLTESDIRSLCQALGDVTPILERIKGPAFGE